MHSFVSILLWLKVLEHLKVLESSISTYWLPTFVRILFSHGTSTMNQRIRHHSSFFTSSFCKTRQESSISTGDYCECTFTIEIPPLYA
ncbi:hypothetical protein MPTK1_4g12330 [Marchantia polymorpha subsp. ruderalis]|uniref:Secreted protein n=2 Tax=Marchantia polymorpha TaxID=3197 RepID=A0AAF6B948_MARPO|nr:hypothetical protein MARPO_0011s0215 [Marchantia polymorpha]BBN08532.1 hypothetical protein Mp_4g12330 [Marchantia polymorpha subsp. ruderalis]|eukprot:PTQ46566.1 hypothetical protein MARPO_0011s0215 [Marchantia polymorpha]